MVNHGILRLSQAEEHLYQELLRLDYPEDRIQRDFRVADDYRADFVVFAPGVSDIPMAVFEVKAYVKNSHIPKAHFLKSAHLTEQNLKCAFYLYVELEQGFETYQFVESELRKVELPRHSDLLKEWKKNTAKFEKVSVKNFTVFKEAEFSFSRKINLIIGENGSGKTQLLKLLYAVSSSMIKRLPTPQKGAIFYQISDYFRLSSETDLINRQAKKLGEDMSIGVQFFNNREFFVEIGSQYGGVALINSLPQKSSFSSVVFLPAKELLSVYPRFLAFYQKYPQEWPYDKACVDTVSYLGLPPLSSQNADVDVICKKIETAIHGSFYLDTQKDRFMMKRSGEEEPYEIDMAAEGWRKLGEVLLLLRCGAITQGSILFWDEPESNLNPALIKVLASVIVELGKLDVQVFLTTHSLFLMRELDMLTKKKGKSQSGEIRYFNFVEPGKVEQGDSPEELSSILILDESLAQSDRFLDQEE